MRRTLPPATGFRRAGPSLRQRLSSFVGTLAPTVTALAVQLGAFAITVRGLGVEAFGTYTALLAIAVIGVELVGWGGADLLIRGVAHDRASFPRYFGMMLALAGLTLPVVTVGGSWIAVAFVGTDLDLFHVAALLVGEITVGRAASSLELVMVAHRDTVRAGWIRLLTAALRLALAFLFFVLLDRHGLAQWIEATLAQSLLTSLAYVLLAIRLYGRPSLSLGRGELGTGGAFCLNQVSRAAQYNLDRVVLGRFADAATIGVYGAATRVLAIGLFPIQVVTRMIYPNFFIHGKRGIRASRRYALRTAPVLGAVGLASSAAVAVAGSYAPLVLGPDFAEMSAISVWLGLALPLIALQYPAADALTGAGRQGVRAVLFVVAAVAFSFALAAGATLGGTNGLIAAFLISHAVLAAALWIATFAVADRQPPARIPGAGVSGEPA